MPADDHVADAEHGERVLDAGRHRVGGRPVHRHEIPGRTDHEQLTGPGLGEQFRYHPGVGAADEQRARPVAGGEPFEEGRSGGVDVAPEAPDAVGEIGVHSHSLLRGTGREADVSTMRDLPL